MILTGLAMAITIAGAILAASRRNVVHAVFGLAIALIGVALAFLALGSPFVAAMQVLIYIGGITVAMIFAVMLSATQGPDEAESAGRRVVAGLCAVVFFAAMAPLIITTDFGLSPVIEEADWSVQTIGRALLDEFNVVFELLSVVLLLAIIGAIAIARRDDPEHDDSAPAEGGSA